MYVFLFVMELVTHLYELRKLSSIELEYSRISVWLAEELVYAGQEFKTTTADK